MMFEKRRWCLSPVADEDTLARMLTGRTHTLCSAFSVAGREDYVFLNDATSEDGAGEWAALKRLPDGSFLQVESITFSWMTEDQARTIIGDVLAGRFDAADYARPVTPRLDASERHRPCRLCD